MIPSKRLRNKISGFTTHLMKRISRGPVRGISLKLQEEERERRMDFVPEVLVLLKESLTRAHTHTHPAPLLPPSPHRCRRWTRTS